MKFRGGEFSTGTTGNFQPELTDLIEQMVAEALLLPKPTAICCCHGLGRCLIDD
jgi:hypothetical protein